MSEDYIRDELQAATSEYIKAVRLALVRTKEARLIAGGGRPSSHYMKMNQIERFHEDRKIAIEAFLHNLESCHSRGMIISIGRWLEMQQCPSTIALEELFGRDMSEDERERIKRTFRPADSGSGGDAGEVSEPAQGGAPVPAGGERQPDTDDTSG